MPTVMRRQSPSRGRRANGTWDHRTMDPSLGPVLTALARGAVATSFGIRGETPRLLEYNADTPTALVEASVAQWFWLKDIDPGGDQFNSIHERLIEAWKKIRKLDDRPIHFAAMSGQIRASLAKRVALRCTPFRVVSWDHAKLDGKY